MFWRDPLFWNDLSKIAPYVLILISALAGGASSFSKTDTPFNIKTYLFEVFSSLVAGSIIYLGLHTTNTPDELIDAISALVAYFGTNALSIFYQMFITKLERISGIQSKNEKE